MINKQQAAGLRTSDNTNGNGTTGLDLGCELVLGQGVLLPLGLIGALVVADGDQAPMVREEVKVLGEWAGGHAVDLLGSRSLREGLAGWRGSVQHLQQIGPRQRCRLRLGRRQAMPAAQA